MQPDLEQRYSTVRVFPNGTRNCYTLRSLKQGGKYLVRATFGYGNYDTLNMLPAFDLYLGVNYWTTVNITNVSMVYIFDIITLAPANYMQICLVNIGSGTPFISEIDLRSLPDDLYPAVSAKQSLVLHSFFRDTVKFGYNRYHFGQYHQLFRYPVDLYDRMWQKYEDVPIWTDIFDTIDGEVKSFPNDSYNAPSAVMRSVSIPVNTSRMDLWWGSDPSMNVGLNSKFFVVLYFAEIEAIRQANVRQFNVFLDNNILADAFSPPKYMLATMLSGTVQGLGLHNVSLVATGTYRLKPAISAMEIYLLRSLNESATNSDDANAMIMIQQVYSVTRNWAGDPCSPISFSWSGLRCSDSPNGLLIITALNLSYSGLIGGIDDSFGQLASLQSLDLSNNNLSGSIPDFLDQMQSLAFLDLSSNNLSGIIPSGLLQKSKYGGFILRIDNNPYLCGTTCYPTPSKNKNKLKLLVKIIVPIVGASTIIVLFVALVFVIQHRSKVIQGVAHATEIFENRRFKYKELKLITNGFKNVIGKGGFGPVYMGCLENGTSVAVKMRSQSSSQGNKEFLAEAQHLSKVHHRNLVSLIGYCNDMKHLGLVYEYMVGGNLEDRLRGQVAPLVQPLTWLQRLTIALDSAYGLEYLHKSCSPPLIHRDVKTRNILLTANLRAKLSDFGLTRAFSSETKTHVTTTQPAGTLGYLDPEYYATSCLSEKSDVYSFGVVLLVLITAQPAIVTIDNEGSTNIVHWVRERLSEGDVESVTDPRIRGDCDVNSVWKAAELALHCTEHAARDRPTMTEVVEGLTESLQLETIRRNSSIGASSLAAAADAESISLVEAAERIGETLPR